MCFQGVLKAMWWPFCGTWTILHRIACLSRVFEEARKGKLSHLVTQIIWRVYALCFSDDHFVLKAWKPYCDIESILQNFCCLKLQESNCWWDSKPSVKNLNFTAVDTHWLWLGSLRMRLTSSCTRGESGQGKIDWLGCPGIGTPISRSWSLHIIIRMLSRWTTRAFSRIRMAVG